MSLTDEEKRIRKGRITGTKIAAIAGLSKWGDALSIYQELTEERVFEPWDNTQSKSMKWGIWMEPLILKWIAEEYQATLTKASTVVCAKNDRFAATPDSIAELPDGTQVIVEAKTSAFGEDWGDISRGQIATYYWPQICWEMMCCNLNSAIVGVQIAGPPKIYEVHRNQALEDILVNMANEFLENHVDKRIPPLGNYTSPACANLMKFIKQNRNNPEWVPPSIKSDIAATNLFDARKKADYHQQIVTASENQLKELIGGGIGIKGVNYVAQWQERTSKLGNSYLAFVVRETK